MADENRPVREVIHERENSSGLWAILIVILVLIIIGFFIFARPAEDDNGGIDIDVNLPGEDDGANNPASNPNGVLY
ncbi:MAG: hypothetical protein Q8P45_03145 [Candidatus Harrisonbacteria bacterium]|nr:hypothetical protein [Candidatus Harrisonbacteria bacterium]